ncbi:nucleotidyltransferase family protein [Qipengyuania sp. DGS5-3]|uniref:nucleotidyltransferase family protein n=1 Tax=Qipengyuania sp. DGS5-3 TaxID=3349632 RepID=UPI0036D42E0A
MAEPYRLAIAVLAAGASRRFGDTDKLTAPFRGKMLGLHACDTLREIEAHHRWVITSKGGHPCEGGWRDAGFEPAVNPEAALGMGTSVALAAQMAMAEHADALIICLADMPLVPAEHFASIIAKVQNRGEGYIAATGYNEVRIPPACFAKGWFTPLTQISGDKGAREFLARGAAVPCAQELLIDIDTPETLAVLSESSTD